MGSSIPVSLRDIDQPVMAAIPPEDDELMNLITWNGAKDLYGKAKGTGLFNLDQDLELQNLKEQWAYQGLWDMAKPHIHLQKLDMVEPDLELQNLSPLNIRRNIRAGIKGTTLRKRLQNLEQDQDLELQNLRNAG